MNIFLTNYSKQRRESLPIIEDAEIIPWIEYFDKLFDFNSRKNAIYKIYFKQRAAIIRKENKKLIVITIRGFTDFSKKEEYFLKIKEVDQKIEKKIYRKDFNGDIVSCGKIEPETFSLKRTLKIKYIIPFFKRDHDIKDLDTFVYFDKENKKYMLNDFERRKDKGERVYRERLNGILVSCGKFLDGKVMLHHNLLGKYIISTEIFFKKEKEHLINYNQKRGKWMLNEFERR